MGPWYVSANTLKDSIDLPSTNVSDDDQIALVIESVSRQIEIQTGHSFQPKVETRRYTARDGMLYTDDILAISSLRTDSSNDRTYPTTLSATCYELAPYNAPLMGPPHPYWRVELTPNSTGTFPTYGNGVQITGTFGFYDVEKQTTKTATTLDATSTSFVVQQATGVQVGNTIKIDSEQMFVNSVTSSTGSSGTLGVDRPVGGTTGSTHSASAPVNVYQYPVIERAALIQAARILNRRRAPLGVVGSVDVGVVRLREGLDPDVTQLLDQFKERVAF